MYLRGGGQLCFMCLKSRLERLPRRKKALLACLIFSSMDFVAIRPFQQPPRHFPVLLTGGKGSLHLTHWCTFLVTSGEDHHFTFLNNKLKEVFLLHQVHLLLQRFCTSRQGADVICMQEAPHVVAGQPQT